MEDRSDDYWSNVNRAAVNGKLIAVESANTFALSRASKDTKQPRISFDNT
jgi:hypothetical protein